MPSLRRVAHPRARSGGFTLLEVLVALAVIGVAIEVFVSLFNSSVDLGRTATHRSIAMQLASDQLEAITRDPNAFKWAIPAKPGAEQFPITLGDDDPPAGNEFGLPTEMPPDVEAFRRQVAELSRFRWSAFARVPESKAPHYEVTVAVRWKEGGREQNLALTTAIDRASVKGHSK